MCVCTNNNITQKVGVRETRERKMENWKYDVVLRLTAAALLILAAFLVRFNTQTKLLFNTIPVKATFTAQDSLFDLVWIDLGAAAYNLLHIMGFFLHPKNQKQDYGILYRRLSWTFYLLDQGVVYVVFGANSAAADSSILALTGAKSLQWMKVCDKFTKFCLQTGASLICGYISSILLAIVSSFSAYNLFRLYSPKRFLLLKNPSINLAS